MTLGYSDQNASLTARDVLSAGPINTYSTRYRLRSAFASGPPAYIWAISVLRSVQSRPRDHIHPGYPNSDCRPVKNTGVLYVGACNTVARGAACSEIDFATAIAWMSNSRYSVAPLIARHTSRAPAST